MDLVRLRSSGVYLVFLTAPFFISLTFFSLRLFSLLVSRDAASQSCWSLVTSPCTSSAPVPAPIFIPDISRSCRTSSRSSRICPSAGLWGPQSLSIKFSYLLSHETAKGIILLTGAPRPLALRHAPPPNAPCAPSHLAPVSPDSLVSNMMVHWSTVTNVKYRIQRGGPPAQWAGGPSVFT